MAIRIERVGTTRDELGEGPVWDVAEGALYWLDIDDREIWRLEPGSGSLRSWRLPGPVGAMALRRDGGAVVAVDARLHLFDFETGKLKLIADLEGDRPKFRVNDGKADARGRFVCGSFQTETKPEGSMYSIDPDYRCTRLLGGISATNGPCFSPDDRTFYYADSTLQRIYALDYDLATGTAANQRVLVDTAAIGGFPDGATVDADGCLWSAFAAGGKIVRFTPQGKVERIVEVPTVTVTSVMFGGKDLDLLYFTSSANGFGGLGDTVKLTEADGGLFAISGLGVKGRPEPRFAG